MNDTTTRGRWAGLWVLLLAAPLAWGQAAAVATTDADRDYWQAEYREVMTEARDARAALEAAENAYSQMQQRNYPRGEAREALVAERKAARERLEKAEAAAEAFPERARRAGALPGWFRDVDLD